MNEYAYFPEKVLICILLLGKKTSREAPHIACLYLAAKIPTKLNIQHFEHENLCLCNFSAAIYRNLKGGFIHYRWSHHILRNVLPFN